MGWKTDLAVDFAGFTFAESTLKMASKSARSGFSIPGANSFGIAKKFGLRTGGFGAVKGVGLQTSIGDYGRYKSLEIFEKAGLTGFRGAQKKAALSYGDKLAAGVGQRYIFGRAAGIALKGANFFLGATMAFDIVKGGYQMGAEAEKKYRGLELGGDYRDTVGAATSRQRAMQAITASSLQARSAIGNEAMLMHR